MNPELAKVLALLSVVIVMFAAGRPRMDAVALIVVCTLPLTGVINMAEALAGFSDPNIVLIAALFVIGDGLVRTGVARQLGDWLTARAGRSEPRLIALLMGTICTLGSAMSSTAITAIFIPITLRICQNVGLAASRLMMPLSMAGLISGMMTLVATAPNLIVHGELVRRGETGFHFFSFTPFGVMTLLLGVAYMLVARRWLPAGTTDAAVSRGRARPRLADWVERYRLAGREHRLRVTERSPLTRETLESFALRDQSGANIVAIQRNGTLLQPTARTRLNAGDILFVDLFAPSADVDALRRQYELEPLPLTGAYFTDQSQEIGMAEVIVPADSELIGKTATSAGFRGRFGLTVIGLRRGTHAVEAGLKDEELRTGDTLLVIGPWKAIRTLQSGGRDLIALSLPVEHDELLPAAGKAVPALFSLGLVVLMMVTGIVPNVQAALIGCLLLGLFGCVDFESSYRAIDWKTIVLIVGMLPFSLALQRTGGVELASAGLMAIISGAGIHGVLAALFVVTAGLGSFISNTATAVLMAPVAMTVADELQASPYPFAMIVALAASAAFTTPVSSPVNTLVVTPGNYRFGDFVRIGVPFTVIVMIASVLLVPVLLPP